MSTVSKTQVTFGAILTAAALHDTDDGHKAAIVHAYIIEFEGDPDELVKAIATLPMVEFVSTMTLDKGLGEK